jgi:lipopolysaccharide biosynthesis regulator YciM
LTGPYISAESIILRPNIDEETKVRALFDLGVDYKRAVFLTAASRTFLNVIKKGHLTLLPLRSLKRYTRR